MEEVPAIVNFFDPDGVPVLDKFCLMLEDGGYGTWEMIKKTLLTPDWGIRCHKKQHQKPPQKAEKEKKKAKKRLSNQVYFNERSR